MFYCINQAHWGRFAVLDGFDSKLSFTGIVIVTCSMSSRQQMHGIDNK